MVLFGHHLLEAPISQVTSVRDDASTYLLKAVYDVVRPRNMVLIVLTTNIDPGEDRRSYVIGVVGVRDALLLGRPGLKGIEPALQVYSFACSRIHPDPFMQVPGYDPHLVRPSRNQLLLRILLEL